MRDEREKMLEEFKYVQSVRLGDKIKIRNEQAVIEEVILIRRGKRSLRVKRSNDGEEFKVGMGDVVRE